MELIDQELDASFCGSSPTNSPPPEPLSDEDREKAELRAALKLELQAEHHEELKALTRKLGEMCGKVKDDIEMTEKLRRQVNERHQSDIEYGGGCFLAGLFLGMAICVSWEEWLRRR